jgi:hypothetical protein
MLKCWGMNFAIEVFYWPLIFDEHFGFNQIDDIF